MNKKDIASFMSRDRKRFGLEAQRLIDEILPKFLFHPGQKLPQYSSYGLEIGFGSGEHLIQMASENPQRFFIGCEPFFSGVVKLLKEIDRLSLTNIAVWNDDARIIIDTIQEQIFDEVHILFSDPWPKKKHHKRRLISTDFLESLAQKMSKDGQLLIATDHVEYAKWILNKLLLSDKFIHKAKLCSDWYNYPQNWVKTKYQMKAEEGGGKPYFFNFIKI